MKTLTTLLFVFIVFHTHLASASGQRSAVITMESIKEYRNLSLKEGKLNEKVLRYMGTVNNKIHILMITKTSYSERSDGRVGMPWSHVFKYKISSENMTIINGWDITDEVKQGINVRPSDCPRVYLSTKQNKYKIQNNKPMKSKCIPIRRFSR